MTDEDDAGPHQAADQVAEVLGILDQVAQPLHQQGVEAPLFGVRLQSVEYW